MKNETEKHYDLLSEDGNDPVLDQPEPREYLLYSTVFLKKRTAGVSLGGFYCETAGFLIKRKAQIII